MRSYDLLQDYLGQGQEDLTKVEPDKVGVNAHWAIAIVRLKYPMSYRRQDRASFSQFFPDAVATRGKTLVITSDAVHIQCTATKSSHLTQMSATLRPGQTNYLSEVLPGDYVFVWMLNEEERHADLLSRIRSGKPCNKFMDGLKFYGKVNGLQKDLSQSPDGFRTVSYNLTGVGFSEFDATLFYDPHLAEKITTIGRLMGRIGANLNQLTTQGMIDVNAAIPYFVDLLLGRGIPTNLGRGNSDPRLKSTAGLEGEYSYIIPQEIGTILGKTVSSKGGGALAAADILELQVGVQNFNRDRTISDYEKGILQESNPDADIDAKNKALVFTPDGPTSGSRRFTGTDMMGRFLPTPPQFTNASVWSILNQYLNPACNEMFTCLRTNGEGNVVPTLVVRQLPFSSNLVKVPFPVTKFQEVPRWVVHPILVRAAHIGRSDSLRFNFVNVQGLQPIDKGTGHTGQLVRNPPFRDDLDIARSGLRNYSTTIPCALEDIKNQTSTSGSTAASNWMDLMADILMGQHLTLTGSIVLVGVQAPICPGDNIEWDGVVFHIESVSHSCQQQADGKKSFSTSLALSHGVRSNPGTEDLEIYAGIKSQDQMAYNPPVTDEGQENKNLLEDASGTKKTQEDRAAVINANLLDSSF